MLLSRFWRLTVRGLWVGAALGLFSNTPAYADRVDDYITARMSQERIPGVSLAVLKNGKLVKMEGYGLANLELQARATPKTVYKIGSVSKQFIAAGIMLLRKEGTLSLDDSITKYLPDAPESWKPITVRHALTHTGGLIRESPAFAPLKAQRDAEVIRAAYASPLRFLPGEKGEYSNLGYFILAEIITRASGKPWPQYLQDRVFAPLGMNSTRTTTIEDLVPHRASGYDWTDNKQQNASFMLGVRPSGAFLSTVEDLAKWDAALYSDRLFSAEERDLMWSPAKLNDGSEHPYGFGWRIEKVGNHRLVSHAGALTGFRAGLSRYIDDHLTVVVLTNAGQANPDRLALGVARFYIPGLLPARKPVKLAAGELERCVGQYRLSGGRLMNVTLRGDRLVLTVTLGDRSQEVAVLTPEGKTQFFDEEDPRSTYAFGADAEGREYLAMKNDEGKEVERWPKM